MPETALATTGAPAAIASTSTFGIPSRSSGSSRHGMQSALARRYSASSSAWPERPRQPHAGVEAVARGSPGARRVAVLVVLADDQRLERDAAPLEHRAGVDHDVEALLGHEPADAEDAQATPFGGGRRGGRLEQPREVRVEPVVDEPDVGLRRDPAQVLDVARRCT